MYLRDTIVVDMRLLGCGDMLRAYRLYIVYHTCGALSREFFYRLAVGLLSAAGTRMPWHPVPSRAFWLYLQYRLLMTCSRLISYVFYKETALGFGFYSDFTSGEYHIVCVDFICSLRGHQRTKEKDSAEPLSSILWTPPPHPGGIRCGGAYLLPRAYSDIVSLYPVLSLLPSSEFCVAICVRAEIACVSVGLLGEYRSFFIIGG